MPRPKGDRTKRFNMLLSPKEFDQLLRLADAAQVDASTWIRNQIASQANDPPKTGLRRAVSPYKTAHSREKARRGAYLDDVRELARGLIEAHDMWHGDVLSSALGPRSDAVKRAAKLDSLRAVNLKIEPEDWPSILARLVIVRPNRRAEPGKLSIADLVVRMVAGNPGINETTARQEIARIVAKHRQGTKGDAR
jgi:hypothetical protein